jgi:small subunit ribosomal protein S20
LANIQSQIKRNRQNEKRRLRNRDFRGAARTAVKDALAAISTGQEPQAAVAHAISALDKAAQKGAIHQRNAARRKSRLIKRLSAQGGAPVSAPGQRAAAAPKAPETKPVEPKIQEPKVKKAATKAATKKAPAKKTAKK